MWRGLNSWRGLDACAAEQHRDYCDPGDGNRDVRKGRCRLRDSSGTTRRLTCFRRRHGQIELLQCKTLVEANRLGVRPQLCSLIEAGRNNSEIVVLERLEMPLWDLRLARDSLERQPAKLAGAPEHLTETVACVPTRARDLNTPGPCEVGVLTGSHGRH